jgi:capsular polysaccharide biosynthesis protein
VRPIAAIFARPLLFLPVMLAGLCIALAIAVSQPKTYKAEARLVFGSVSVDTNAVGGYTTASQQLAGVYARFVTATDSLQTISAKVGKPVSEIENKVAASPIPNSPIIRVTGEASNEADAVALASAAADSLTTYVNNLNSSDAAASAYQKQYQDAAAQLTTAQANVTALQNQLDALNRAGAPAADVNAKQGELAAAQSIESQAQLQTTALLTLYTDALKTGATSNQLRLFSQATAESSGRLKTFAIAGFAGIVVGALVGAVLATWAANGWHVLPAEARAERLRRKKPAKPGKGKPVNVKPHGPKPDGWAAPAGATPTASDDAVASVGRR